MQRFFSLHYLLPFVILGVVILHIWALHVVGQNNPAGVDPQTEKDTVAFTPYATHEGCFLRSGVFCILYGWFVFYIPNYLGHPDNYIPANPGVTPTHIVPEWYYLPFYAILRSIPNKLLGVVALFASIIVLAFLPWLDSSKVRSATYRPLYRQFFWIFVVVCVGLGWLGSKPPEGIYVIVARLFTAWYFIHFLIILPLLGRLETPRPLPNSISEAVLKKRAVATAAVLVVLHRDRPCRAPGLVEQRPRPKKGRSRRARNGHSGGRSASMTRRNCSGGSRFIARSARPATA